MAEQYDFYWHGPFSLDSNREITPQKRLETAIPSPLTGKKGVYMIIGQDGWRPWTRRPLYIGATMNSFWYRLLAHLTPTSTAGAIMPEVEAGLETADDDPAKMVRAENEGWRITSIWLGELRSSFKSSVHHLVHAERTMIFYFDPKLNKALKKNPSTECTIINRINTGYIEPKFLEWQATKLPSIWDMRPANMKLGGVGAAEVIAEIYWKKGAGAHHFQRKYLSYERGALWKRRFCKKPFSTEFEKPSIFP